MGTGTNLAAQLGVKEEVTHGTPVTVDRFFPLITDGVKATRPQIVSAGLIAGRVTYDVDQVKYGMQSVAGPVNMEVYAQSQGLWWKWALGTLTSTAGSNPYTHTFNPGGTLPSFTMQIATRDVGDTQRAKTYAGCKVNAITLAAQADQAATLVPEIIGGVAETWATGVASASYATNAMIPMVFREGSVTVNGDAAKCTAFEIKIDNQLQVRPHAGRSITAEPKRGDRVKVTGKCTIELEDLTESNLYVNGTEIDIILALSDGTYSTTVTVHTKLSGDTPCVQGPGINMFDLTWENAFGDGTDADGLTVVYVDATSAP